MPATQVPDKQLHAAQDLLRMSDHEGSMFSMEDVERIAALAGIQPTELIDLAILLKEEGVQGDGSVFVPVCDWLERNYHIVETAEPIYLYPFQRAILDYMFPFSAWSPDTTTFWSEMVYSTIKKSGKTSLTGGVARWVAEQWKPWPLVMTGANDLTQSRTRIYQAVLTSLKLMPGWDNDKRLVRGPDNSVQWNVTEDAILYLPNNGTIKALSSDYRGEAGANPTATFFSELWGFTLDKLQKLWAEMTPVPTRPGAFRWSETYAGFKNERGPLNELYDQAVKNGEQLNCHTMPGWPTPDLDCNCYNTHGCCPEHDTGVNRSEGLGYPLFVDRKAGLVAYWDMGIKARRLPWQNERYYEQQRAKFKNDLPGYERLHENKWTESIDAYVQISWFDGNEDDHLKELLKEHQATYGIVGNEPIVLALDAGVNSDCCAVAMVTRYPTEARKDEACLRAQWIWYPPVGGVFNYQDTIEKKVRQMCGCFFDHTKPEEGHANCHHHKPFNVVCIAYDAYQLHDMVQRLQRDGLAWFHNFSQGADRGAADKQLLDNIRDRRFAHPGQTLIANDGYGEPDGLIVFREQLAVADKKTAADDNTKCRIIKRDDESKIDGPVSASMAAFTVKRLNFD